MFALFLAISVAMSVVIWAELNPALMARLRSRRQIGEPPSGGRAAVAKGFASDDTERVRAQMKRLLEQAPPRIEPVQPPCSGGRAPMPMADTAAPMADRTAEGEHDAHLPRIVDFQPGDLIEIEIEGPLPRREDLRFEPAGNDARLLIEGEPVLLVVGMQAQQMAHGALRLRARQAA